VLREIHQRTITQSVQQREIKKLLITPSVHSFVRSLMGVFTIRAKLNGEK
jgi:hypothetical protein